MSLAALKKTLEIAEALRKLLYTADIYGDFNDKDERDEREPDGIVIYRESTSEHDPEMTVCAEDLELLIEYCASFEYKTYAIYKNGNRIGTGRSEVDSNGINPRFEYDDTDYKP